MHAHEARHAACLALGALVASPWAADFAEAEEHSDAEASGIGASEASTSTDVGVGSVGERAGQQKDAQAVVLKKLREKGFQKQLLAPLGQAAIAEDRCVPTVSSFRAEKTKRKRKRSEQSSFCRHALFTACWACPGTSKLGAAE